MGLMMTIRQQEILEAIINEYTQTGEPVTSRCLEEEYDFGIKGAMIRREMQELCNTGYLMQPHVSAGRIPTEKAYRVYVDKLLLAEETSDGKRGKKMLNRFDAIIEIIELESEQQDALHMLSWLCKKIALLVSNLTLGYLSDFNIILKEGWEIILRDPGFHRSKSLSELALMLEVMEKNFDELMLEEKEIRAYIGSENPFAKIPSFSTIITKVRLPGARKATFAVAGPLHMDYDRTISTLMAVKEILDSEKNN